MGFLVSCITAWLYSQSISCHYSLASKCLSITNPRQQNHHLNKNAYRKLKIHKIMGAYIMKVFGNNSCMNNRIIPAVIVYFCDQARNSWKRSLFSLRFNNNVEESLIYRCEKCSTAFDYSINTRSTIFLLPIDIRCTLCWLLLIDQTNPPLQTLIFLIFRSNSQTTLPMFWFTQTYTVWLKVWPHSAHL